MEVMVMRVVSLLGWMKKGSARYRKKKADQGRSFLTLSAAMASGYWLPKWVRA
jgi:hypothetical protein